MSGNTVKERKPHLSLYLMKAQTTVDDVIRDLSGVSQYQLTSKELRGKLFLKRKEGDAPWWAEFLNPITKEDIKIPSSRTTSAVLVLEIDDDDATSRIVCFTFGHGRHLLDQNKIERPFGLRVVLNSIDVSKLRSFDVRRQSDIVVNSRIQSSIATSLDTFNLDTLQDIMTKAVGSTNPNIEGDLGKFVRGSDGISFDVDISPPDLAVRAKNIVNIYRRENYKETFSFVDHILPVDQEYSQELDDALEVELQSLSLGRSSVFRCLYLAPPEIIDFETLEGFSFTSESDEGRELHTDLSLNRYLDTLEGKRTGITIKRTKKTDRVILKLEGTESFRPWSVYRAIVAEFEHNGTLFQLVDGCWYRIEDDFATYIGQSVSDIDESKIEFPNHINGETEGDYNCRAAAGLGALLMDCKNIPLGGGANRIEFCDILLADRTLVHAKKRASSSTLSHLWSQGTVAMQALLGDEDFRGRVQNKIVEEDSSFEHAIGPNVAGHQYTLVYLILGRKEGNSLSQTLPFFSQVALVQATKVLRSMGITVEIAGVHSV